MERFHKQLLELTRCGIWGRAVDYAHFEDGCEWSALLETAQRQTLLGVISPAIEQLPDVLRPSRGAMLRLQMMVVRNRQIRSHQIGVLRDVLQILNRAGVERPVLLKGFGVGMNYPDPDLRMCGDIDLYVGDRYYLDVIDLICSELGIDKATAHWDHHFEFKYRDIPIEIHQYAISPRSITFNREEAVGWCTEQLEGEALRRVDIEGVEVFLPPYNFDYIYIFFHMWRHFLTGGVGMRQLCDWCCYIDRYAEEFDREEIGRVTALFRIERAIPIFATIAVRELGVAPRKMPNYVEVSRSVYRKALDRVWSRGNFGHYNPLLKRRSRGGLRAKALGFLAMVGDMIYLMGVDPEYAVKLYSGNIVGGVKAALFVDLPAHIKKRE